MAAGRSVRIDLLGGFSVSVGDAKVAEEAWRLRKAKALVKLLALAAGRHLHWEQIGEALWPGRDLAAARNSFDQALRAAREALASVGEDGRRVLTLRDGVVAFGDDVAVEVDVDAFTAAVDHAHAARTLAAYRAAAGRYAGELLPQDRYEEWASAPREALREQHSALLLELAQLQRERGDPVAATDTLRSLLVQHELHEPARRELMDLLAASGRRQEALAEYESLRDALQRTLAADPDPETRRLYRGLLAGSLEDPEQEPAIGASDPARTDNLPVAASSFVGREREVVEVERLLERTRLLTLTGVGGAGKTRLAVEVARRRLGAYVHGVWLVDLAPSSEPGHVPQAVAQVLGLELPERRAPIPALVGQLIARRLLLVLDNCEHLIVTCAELVAAILRSCPGLVVLATSREALQVEGEVAWRVPSLALPDLNRLPEPPALARQAAVQLFCERASAAEPGFELNTRNARTVAELCVRLDGMPLALELAAARVRMLSPRQILERLGDALDVLEGGSRTGLSRQRTLNATLDWSHELLDDAERVAFRRLAVFAGSFALEAAEHVCGVEPLDRGVVLGLVGGLVDKSLVVVEPHGDVARYRLLETVRQYALDRLGDAQERALIEQRHRAWYRDWALANDPERAAAAGEEAVHHFDVEHDNLRAALRSALADEHETALHLATSLWRFWLSRGHFAEGRRWLEATLEANPAKTSERARGLNAVAVLDMRYGADSSRLERIADEIVDIHLGLGDQVELAQAFHLAAVLLWTGHRWDDAEHLLDRACALARDHAAEYIHAAATHTRGVIALTRGQPGAAQTHFAACEALLTGVGQAHRGFFPTISAGFSVEWDEGRYPRAVFEETLVAGHRIDAGPAAALLRFSQGWAARAGGALETAIAYGDDSAGRFGTEGWSYGVALAHNLLGNLHRLAGDHGTARRHLEHSLRLRAQLGDRRATGVTLGGLGLLAAAEDDVDGAQRYMRRALALFERIEDGFGEVGMLVNLGVAWLRAGDLDSARRLLEQAQKLRDAPGRQRTLGWVAVMLAEIAERQGDERTAAGHRARARTTFARLGEHMGLRHCEQLDATLPR